VRHDRYYIEHLGPWIDLRILVATVAYVLGNPMGLTRRLVPNPESVEDDKPATLPMPGRVRLSA
jgi:hypothetical protein